MYVFLLFYFLLKTMKRKLHVPAYLTNYTYRYM